MDELLLQSGDICPRCQSTQGNEYCNSKHQINDPKWRLQYRPQIVRHDINLKTREHEETILNARLNCPLCNWIYYFPIKE